MITLKSISSDIADGIKYEIRKIIDYHTLPYSVVVKNESDGYFSVKFILNGDEDKPISYLLCQVHGVHGQDILLRVIPRRTCRLLQEDPPPAWGKTDWNRQDWRFDPIIVAADARILLALLETTADTERMNKEAIEKVVNS